MSAVTALIAEDELPQRRELKALLALLWPELQVVAECSDGLAALEAIATLHPQVAFLDIRMPGVSGLEVARAASGHAHVIFTTAYEEYALRAFDEGAVDYLIKPIGRERLQRAVHRAKSRLRVDPQPDVAGLIDAVQAQIAAAASPGIRWITATKGNTVQMYAIDEVLFFQAQDKYTRVVTDQEEAYIRTPLKELLGALDSGAFWQIHRSAIVRVSAIRSVERDIDGRLLLRIRGRTDVLPVSSAFNYRFKGM
jgi:DNA-binding LytR/AlgR family response regulator